MGFPDSRQAPVALRKARRRRDCMAPPLALLQRATAGWEVADHDYLANAPTIVGFDEKSPPADRARFVLDRQREHATELISQAAP